MDKIQYIPETVENQNNESIIKLSFMRHSIKAKAKEGQTDYDITLTPEGGKLAVNSTEKKGIDPNVDQALAFGSPRLRAQETALKVMLSETGIQGDEDPKQLLEEINSEFALGSKLGIDERLDFVYYPETTELGKKLDDAYMNGTGLKYLIEESDQDAIKLKDTQNFTYSRAASDIGKIVKKYLDISSRWNQLVNDESKHYEKTLERYLVSHQSILESFLAKVIEKTEGITKRDEFVSLLNNTGFDFVEGFNIQITQENKDLPAKIYIDYERKDQKDNSIFSVKTEISQKLLEEIIEEGNILKQ